MEIPENPVIFELAGVSWTLGALLMISAIVPLVAWAVLLPRVARRYGTVRRLSSEEAAKFAFTGHKDVGEMDPTVYGPGAGAEWAVSITIGDLRALWQQRRYGMFFCIPLWANLFSLAFALIGHGAVLLLRLWVLDLFGAFAALIVALYAFMMWAAVYTKLE